MIELPHLSVLQQAFQRLRLRAAAELAFGRNIDAMKDLNLMFYLSDTIKDEPMLISGLVRVGFQRLENAVLMEGLAGHNWSDGQLEEIQRHLLPCNYVADFRRALFSQRAYSVAVADYYRTTKGFNGMFDDSRDSSDPLMEEPFPGWLIPRRWFHLEKINLIRTLDTCFQSVLDPDAKRIFLLRLKANMDAEAPMPGADTILHTMETENGPPNADVLSDIEVLLQHRLMAREFYNWTDGSFLRRFAGAQCMADEGAIACGLERYLLAKGDYPANLDALVPDFVPALPHDVLTGEPYRYRRESAQKFTLYSVGWNLKDDGGKAGAKAFGEDGDWVW